MTLRATLTAVFLLIASIAIAKDATPESAVPPPDIPPATPKPMPIPLSVVEKLDQPEPPRSNFDLLNARIAQIMHDSPTSYALRAFVADVDSPISLYEREGARSEYPGSLVKVLTTAAALDRLGARYKYRTTVRACGKLDGSRLDGDIVIQGSGDPTLGSPDAPPDCRPDALLASMVAGIREAGIHAVWGRIMGDGQLFGPEERRNDWPTEIPPGSHPAAVSALSFHENMAWVTVIGGGRPRRKVQYVVSPTTDYLTVNGLVRTVPDDKAEPVRIESPTDNNVVTVHGRITPRSEIRLPVAICQPPLFAATMLRDALLHADVTIASDHAVDLKDTDSADAPSSKTWPVAIHFSPPLGDILHTALRKDSHLYADLVARTLARQRLGDATFDAAGTAVTLFLHENQITQMDTKVVDGSGLSPDNSVSPRLVVDVLKLMARGSEAGAMLACFPTPLEPGPLAERMGTAAEYNPQASARIHALVGSLDRPQVAAGYVTTAAGARFAFAFVFDVPSSDRPAVWSLVQRILMAIASSELAPPPA